MSLYEERKRLEQEDGEPLHTLRVTPDSEIAVQCNNAGVLVVAGEWGLTPENEARFVTPLAELGYFVVAIDLVGGDKATSEGQAAERTLDPERGVADIASALLYLKELAGGNIGVVGFDGATAIVIEAATRLPQIDCVVAGGGPGPRKGVQLARTRSSMMFHRGTQTRRLTDDVRAELKERIKPAVQTLMVHDYDAPDRFFARPLDEEERDHATTAFDRTSDFLAQNLI